MGGNVECVEIVIDVLDFGSARDGETEPAEQVDQLVGGLGQGMAVPEPGPDARQGDVEAGRRRAAPLDARPGRSQAASSAVLAALNCWPYARRLAGSSDLSRSWAALSRPCFWPR